MNNLSMMIVDDAEINRAILANFFREEYRILEAENGQVAWDYLQAGEQVDIILLDIMMEVMDGIEFLKLLKSSPQHENIPVIVNSQKENGKEQLLALELGADEFMDKPYQPQLLKHRVRNLVEKQGLMRSNQELLRRVEHDALTGLYNRETFFKKTEEMLASDLDGRYVMALWNIDRFKLINEMFGRKAADEILVFFAKRLSEAIGNEGTYGRLEADHFAMCVSEARMKRIEQNMDQILEIGIQANIVDYPLFTNVGLYRIEDRSKPVDFMCDRARLAMESVKGNAIRHWSYFDPQEHEMLLDEADVIKEMTQALKQRQFSVRLQPIMDAQTGELVSAEALVRWEHPEKGTISPGIFIPVFEKNGFIVRLDTYVWEEVCRIISEEQITVPVSINVSRVNFYTKDLCERLLGLTEKYHILPSRLKIEITESVYTDNPMQLIDTIARLHDYGFLVLMDDFGSGYSSLNMLKDIPVDILKIDMEFVRNLEDSDRGCNILYSVINMAHALGMDTIAEGVETKNQYEMLRNLGCDSIQGYYFSKPLTIEEFVALMNEEHDRSGTQIVEKCPTLLIVEDNVVVRTKICEILSDDYNILLAENGEEALSVLKEQFANVSMVITDIVMPKMNGIELIEQMGRNPLMKKIPVLVVSAYGDAENAIEAISRGASDVIGKPVPPEILKQRINNILKIESVEALNLELYLLRKDLMK
jgi:diguanylate cyclase (GGDEF)-like protein